MRPAFWNYCGTPDLPAAGGGLFGLGLVDAQGAAVKFLAVQGGNGLGGIGVAHFHKAEATGAAGVAVRNELHGKNFAKGLEEGFNAFLRRGPW